MEKQEEFQLTSTEEEPPSSQNFNNWKWQLQNSITDKTTLEKHLILTQEEKDYFNHEHSNHIKFKITPYYMDLVKKFPILRKTMIPTSNEFIVSKGESDDPLDEDKVRPLPNILHRYKNRVLLLSTNQCSSFCRFSLSGDTNILLSDFSEKKIKDIQIGDEIVSHTGKAQKVYDIFNREYTDSLLEIKTSRNMKIKTTKEHPFLVLPKEQILCNQGKEKTCKPNSTLCKKRHPKKIRNFEPRFIEAFYIKEGDYLVTPLYEKKENIIFDNIYEAYLMGIYIGDGDLPKRNDGSNIGIRFSLGIAEKTALIPKIKECCEKLNIKRHYHYDYKPSNVFSYIINDNVYREKFLKHCGMYSDKKRLSIEILYNSTDEFKLHLLRGMLDSDGWYGIKKGKLWGNSYSLEFNSISKILINQIFMLLVHLGFMPSIYTLDEVGKAKKNPGTKNIVITKHIDYSVRLSNKQDYLLFLKNELPIKDKTYNKFTESFTYNEFLYSKILSIKTINNENIVYDLSIENDESYIANFLSVHNCTRSRIVGNEIENNLEEAISYIREHKEVNDVIISGGDALMNSTEKLHYMLSELNKIEHIKIIRLGTKVPAVMPMRIDNELVNMLSEFWRKLYINIHFTHFVELTNQTKIACLKLAKAGIALGSQTVLLQGVNDDANVLKELFQNLLSIKVIPRYLYSMDRIKGSKHFFVPIERGKEIMKELHNGSISGMAIPKYILDSAEGKKLIHY